MEITLYTIGHGGRSTGELLDLLAAAGVATLVDVRRRPRSSRHPHFSLAPLRAAAQVAGLTYHWAGRQLGGFREVLDESPHIALPADGLRGYADYMDTEDFARAAAQLAGLARRAPTAILCAEKEPARCHRSLIADYLTLHGATVLHLGAGARAVEHRLSPYLRPESGRLVYDRGVTGALDL